MELFQAIRGRRTVRRFLNRPVEKELIERILEAATWAPSAHNAQPWRFYVITDPDVKRRLAEEMAGAWERDLEADGVPSEERRSLTSESVKRITGAPVAVLACMTMRDMDRYPDEKRMMAERTMAVQSVAAAVQNMLLAAHGLGLGACWMCAPLFCPDVVRRALGMPEDVEPQALILVGYPAEKPEPPKRKPLSEVSVWV